MHARGYVFIFSLFLRSIEPISVSDAGPFTSSFFTGLGNIYRFGDAMVIDQMGSNRTIATVALLRGNANLSFSCDIRQVAILYLIKGGSHTS